MSIKTIRSGDKDWLINDGLVVSTRAALEISNRCPYEYRLILQECISHEWIKPVAYVHDKELTWDALR